MAIRVDDRVINDTGIYKTETVQLMKNGKFVPGWREAAEKFFRASNRGLDPDALLEEARALGLLVLDGHSARFDRFVVENGVRRILEDRVPSDRPPYHVDRDAEPMVKDASSLMQEVDAATAALRSGDIRKFGVQMYMVGVLSDRIYVRQFEGAAKIAKDSGKAFRWRGTWLRVTPKERLILEAMITTTELPLAELVRWVWKKTYNADYRDTFDQAFSRLNRKLADAGLPFQLHVRDDRLLLT